MLRHLPDADRLRPPNWAAYLDEHEDGVVWRARCETCSWSVEAQTEPALEEAMAAHDRRVHAPAG